MTRVFARLIAATLALTLLLTAETMALVRGETPAVDEIILCTGHGPIRIHVDAEGDPTLGAHICPDCLTLFAGFDAQTGLSHPDRTLDTVEFALVTREVSTKEPALAPSARAPPRFV